MVRIRDIIAELEQTAPLGLQEDYDNCGVQVGETTGECTGVLIALDPTPEAVGEAVAKGCNLLVTHHPLLFKPLRRITGASRVQRTVMQALRSGVTIYSLHTALDSATEGVSWEMGKRLELKEMRTLAPQRDKMLKLTIFVPSSHVTEVSDALFRAGAGAMGRYDRCSFGVKGRGSYRPLEGSSPFRGHAGHEHFEEEVRLEVMLPDWMRDKVERALAEAHPYEVPAYEFVRTENVASGVGLGIVGELPIPASALELAADVKSAFGSPVVRCNRWPADRLIRKVALCGGSGSSLISDALAAGADAMITSDTSYHTFVDNDNSILILDIGHYESEKCATDIFYNVITEKFANFAVHYCETESNPIIYL